jgi:hypothetical protein
VRIFDKFNISEISTYGTVASRKENTAATTHQYVTFIITSNKHFTGLEFYPMAIWARVHSTVAHKLNPVPILDYECK